MKPLRKRIRKLKPSFARLFNPLLLKFRLGYVYEEGEWRFRRIREKPKRLRHTFEDGTPNWNLDGAAPLPFEANTIRRMIDIKPEGPVGKVQYPRMKTARRYIPADMGVEGFFKALNEQGVSYAVLRWFENLPDIAAGEDIDILVADENIDFIDDLLLAPKRKGAIKCDIYSASGVPGSDFKGLPYYERRLAGEILAHTRMEKDLFQVPDPRRHFLSLAYHAVYHKAERSGLPFKLGEAPFAEPNDHNYAATLSGLAGTLGMEIEPSLRGLHQCLAEHDWVPATDTIRKLSGTRPVLKRLLEDHSEPLPPERELSVFIVRDWAGERDLLPWITANLRYYGFDIKIVRVLDEVERANAAGRIRGGNWNQGPFPVSGGEPYALIAACDYTPDPADWEIKREFPDAVNGRSVLMKKLLRDGIKRAVPSGLRANAVHGADDEWEAWDYIRMACPALLETVRKRVDEGYRGEPALKLRLHRGKRATSYVVYRDGRPCVLKVFSDHVDGRKAYNAEMQAVETFSALPWAPEWIDTGPNWILQRFYPQSLRLDRIARTVSEGERRSIAADIAGVIADIWQSGHAHRDIHSENFFVTGSGIRLIDFETLCEQSRDIPLDQSYDVTGKGLESPFTTGATGFDSVKNDRSIRNVLGLRFEDAITEFRQRGSSAQRSVPEGKTRRRKAG